ncbi:MAG: hypothetical protein KGL39_51825 [Patescibacteria group bacterium]|nr:hypothetical protein [Patescibacteria group bacterium]
MRKRAQNPHKQVSRTVSIPAPTGGLNARDALANMPETDAPLMDNYFPTPSSVNLRNGSTNWLTGLPAWVETLMHYSSPTAKKLFAISGTAIYDATTSGAAGAAVVTGLTNARFQFTNIGTSGGNFMVAVNGADKLQGYDGTNWWVDGNGTHDITGFDTSTAIEPHLFKNRLWFVEKNTMKVWYLGVQSIAGAAASIDFSTIFHLGGHLVSMTSWTIDNISGIDDYAVFITSEGEFAVYKGTDPTSSTTWSLVGVFRIGRPVGNRPCIKLGSDVLLICADGVFPLSKALLTDRTAMKNSISDKIINLINTDIQLYNGNFGWQAALYPMGQKLIINVPQVENNTQYQYVMNTRNQSWCRFTGWNAACWEFFNDAIYYGGNGVVVQADTGTDDNGTAITGDVQQAYSYFGDAGNLKRFTMARPVLQAAGNISASVALNIDFNSNIPTSTPTFSGGGASPWNTSAWNVTPWGKALGLVRKWQTVNGVGYAGGLRMRLSAKGFAVQWMSTDFVYEPGNVL